MSDFTLKDLNFSRCRHWIIDAKSKQDIDPVYSFIAGWISFNHFYGTYASSNRADFLKWGKNRDGDKAQLLYLVSRTDFIDFIGVLKREQKELFETVIELPIINLLNGEGVPVGVKGKCKLADLQIEQVFLIIYQIRNNLFHGNKDPWINRRDNRLSQFGSHFMLIFLSTLLSHTSGEVLDAWDNEQQQKIKNVANIAKISMSK